MIQKYGSFLILIAATVLITGCGKNCRDENCPNLAIPGFLFRIQNSAGKDLLTGPFKQYDTSEIEIFGKRLTDGGLDPVRRKFNYIASDESITVYFVASTTYEPFYLKIKDVVTDSFYFGYRLNVTACCDQSYYFLKRVNNNTNVSVSLPNTRYNLIHP